MAEESKFMGGDDEGEALLLAMQSGGKPKQEDEQAEPDEKSLSWLAAGRGAELVKPPQQGLHSIRKKWRGQKGKSLRNEAKRQYEISLAKLRSGGMGTAHLDSVAYNGIVFGRKVNEIAGDFAEAIGGDPADFIHMALLAEIRAGGRSRDKGIGSTVQAAGRWLADRWAAAEARYGRQAAATMALASLLTFPLPFNITAVIAVAEGIRGLHGWFAGNKYLPMEVKSPSLNRKKSFKGIGDTNLRFVVEGSKAGSGYADLKVIGSYDTFEEAEKLANMIIQGGIYGYTSCNVRDTKTGEIRVRR